MSNLFLLVKLFPKLLRLFSSQYLGRLCLQYRTLLLCYSSTLLLSLSVSFLFLSISLTAAWCFAPDDVAALPTPARHAFGNFPANYNASRWRPRALPASLPRLPRLPRLLLLCVVCAVGNQRRVASCRVLLF